MLPSFAGYKSELARFEKRSERGGFFTTKPLSFGEFVLHDTSDKNFTPYIKSIKQPGGFIKMSKPYTKSSTTVLKSNTLGESFAKKAVVKNSRPPERPVISSDALFGNRGLEPTTPPKGRPLQEVGVRS